LSKPKLRKADARGRSKGESAHVRLYLWELRSPAYQSLSVGARALLVELKALYNGANNGSLFLSVREAALRLGVGKNKAADCLDELKETGFIRPNRTGHFNMKSAVRRGNATSWILTEYACGNELAKKDFMHWRPSPGEKRSTVSQRGLTVPVSETRPTIRGPSVPVTGKTFH